MPHSRKSVLRRLGTAIRQERSRQGISQEDLALRAEMNRTYVGGVERGEANISVLSIQKIAEVLRVRSSVLLEKAGL